MLHNCSLAEGNYWALTIFSINDESPLVHLAMSVSHASLPAFAIKGPWHRLSKQEHSYHKCDWLHLCLTTQMSAIIEVHSYVIRRAWSHDQHLSHIIRCIDILRNCTAKVFIMLQVIHLNPMEGISMHINNGKKQQVFIPVKAIITQGPQVINTWIVLFLIRCNTKHVFPFLCRCTVGSWHCCIMGCKTRSMHCVLRYLCFMLLHLFSTAQDEDIRSKSTSVFISHTCYACCLYIKNGCIFKCIQLQRCMDCKALYSMTLN